MNIKEAKEEIKKAVQAYTAKTAAGVYRIPVQRQRPLLLIGPPGIGKTAIMEQIAAECGLGLVAYTMTHHTRQSAIGLPMLEKKIFGEQEFTITSYTMSEIIASVYEQMEQTGCREGILFLDEINCVSETLMPAMLQFLQYKSFGSHHLPEGWIIVAAGNPIAHNRSVREFDTVTLDRVKKIEVEPDLRVWKRYALEKGLHPAVLSFLELKPECFYVLEAGKKGFVTGRGWEDLSEMLLTMEALQIPVETVLFGQYLQHEATAREFAFYYQLYETWKNRLSPEQILQGNGVPEGEELPKLPFDERLCILWLLLQNIYGRATQAKKHTTLAKSLYYFAEGVLRSSLPFPRAVEEQLERRKKAFEVKKNFGLLPPEEEELEICLTELVNKALQEERISRKTENLEAYVEKERKNAERVQEETLRAAENCIQFTRHTFGEGQELVIVLSGLLEHPDTGKLLQEELAEVYQKGTQFLNVDHKEEELRRRLQQED